MAVQSIDDLQKIIRKFCDDRNWDQFHNAKDLSISLSLEAAELLEHFQWKNEEEITTYLHNAKTDVTAELADVFYWVLLIANKLNINLDEALTLKMQKNEQKYPIEKARDNHKKYTDL